MNLEVTEMTNADQNFNLNARGKRPSFFEAAETDALMTALLETMSQLWATRNQVNVLQKVLIGRGLLSASELDEFLSTDADKAEDHEAMQNFFADAFRSMGIATQSLESRQKEIDRLQDEDTGDP